MKVMTGRNILARDKGRRRLFEHTRDQGEQVETLWESRKTIRHLTREEGQDTWNETGKLVIFQNKTGNDETRHEQNANRDSLSQTLVVTCPYANLRPCIYIYS